MDNILIIITGGTIDSITKGQKRDALLKHSAVPEYLQKLQLHENLEFIEVCMKDSRDITDGDRKEILEIIERSTCQKIIITHGTFSMAQTARFLQKFLIKQNQKIILTGSLTPLVGFENSDAPLNLKFSIEQLRILPGGVYVCMNGKSLPAEEATKNEKTGKFYSASKK